MSFVECLRQIFRLFAASLSHVWTTAAVTSGSLRHFFDDFAGVDTARYGIFVGFYDEVYFVAEYGAEYDNARFSNLLQIRSALFLSSSIFEA